MTNQNEHLSLSLQGLGLSQHEILVYLAVLELGPSSIWEIAQKSGVKRTTCYTVLEDLSVKALASSSNDGKREVYTVVSPKQLLRLAEYRYERIISSVTQLEALASKSVQKPKIQLYEGPEGVQQVLNLVLDLPRGNEFLMIGTNMITQSSLGEYIEDFIRKRKERKLLSRAIFPDLEENRAFMARDQNDLRQTRLLPSDKFVPRKITYIIGDVIADIAHIETDPFATIIQSAASAYDEKQKFELLWEIAKKPEEI